MHQSPESDSGQPSRWVGVRAACRHFRVGRLAVLSSVLIAVGVAGAVVRCESVWLSVAAYVLLMAGALYPARRLLRLGLDANSEQLEPMTTRVPGQPGVAKLNVGAIGQRVDRRYDAFAGLLGLVLAFVGLTLSVLLLPVLRAFGVFACVGG